MANPQTRPVLPAQIRPAFGGNPLEAMQAARQNFMSAIDQGEQSFIQDPLNRQVDAFNRVKTADELQLAQARDQAFSQGSQGQQGWLKTGQEQALANLQNAAGIDHMARLKRNEAVRAGMPELLEQEQGIKDTVRSSEQMKQNLAAQQLVENRYQEVANAATGAMQDYVRNKTIDYGGKEYAYDPSYSNLFVRSDTDQQEIKELTKNTKGELNDEMSQAIKYLEIGYGGTVTPAMVAQATNSDLEESSIFWDDEDLKAKGGIKNRYTTIGKKLRAVENADKDIQKQAGKVEQELGKVKSGLESQIKVFNTQQGENSLRRTFGNTIPDKVFKLASSLGSSYTTAYSPDSTENEVNDAKSNIKKTEKRIKDSLKGTGVQAEEVIQQVTNSGGVDQTTADDVPNFSADHFTREEEVRANPRTKGRGIGAGGSGESNPVSNSIVNGIDNIRAAAKRRNDYLRRTEGGTYPDALAKPRIPTSTVDSTPKSNAIAGVSRGMPLSSLSPAEQDAFAALPLKEQKAAYDRAPTSNANSYLEREEGRKRIESMLNNAVSSVAPSVTDTRRNLGDTPVEQAAAPTSSIESLEFDSTTPITEATAKKEKLFREQAANIYPNGSEEGVKAFIQAMAGAKTQKARDIVINDYSKGKFEDIGLGFETNYIGKKYDLSGNFSPSGL